MLLLRMELGCWRGLGPAKVDGGGWVVRGSLGPQQWWHGERPASLWLLDVPGPRWSAYGVSGTRAPELLAACTCKYSWLLR